MGNPPIPVTILFPQMRSDNLYSSGASFPQVMGEDSNCQAKAKPSAKESELKGSAASPRKTGGTTREDYTTGLTPGAANSGHFRGAPAHSLDS